MLGGLEEAIKSAKERGLILSRWSSSSPLELKILGSNPRQATHNVLGIHIALLLYLVTYVICIVILLISGKGQSQQDEK
jgi:hypothetical protein